MSHIQTYNSRKSYDAIATDYLERKYNGVGCLKKYNKPIEDELYEYMREWIGQEYDSDADDGKEAARINKDYFAKFVNGNQKS